MTKEVLYDKIKNILVNDFELEESQISPEANMVNDLDMDSIDFIDMIGKMRSIIPTKINPDIFKNVSTVQSVVDSLYPYVESVENV